MVWQPAPGEEQYYSTPAPADSQSALRQLLTQVTGPGADPTFGRAALPRSPFESKLHEEYPWREGKVLTGQLNGKEWVSYQVWEPKAGVQLKGEFRKSCINPSVLQRKLRRGCTDIC
jgi:hypothetical protein